MLNPITATSLDVRHGFFTRQGGTSNGIYASLNCGPGSADRAEDVQHNRDRVAAHLNAEALQTVHQIHSAKVVTVVGPPPAERPRADAMVTAVPGVAVAALAADCAPVLFADAQNAVIGAAHAGWKGALAGVLDATVSAMISLGARTETLYAVVGPCISQRAYEVGPEFMDRFLEDDPQTDRFFAGGLGDRMHFDLPGYALSRLRSCGITAEWTGHCTFSDAERFFSYRRTTHAGEADYGRQISAIRL
ncbi:MAG: peptidoglycan editing factor PgeF [Pseudomonadota bacterium]